MVVGGQGQQPHLGICGGKFTLMVSPGGGGLALHLLAVPHLHGAVVGGRSKDGVFVRHTDAVDGGFVLMEVSDQETLRVPA